MTDLDHFRIDAMDPRQPAAKRLYEQVAEKLTARIASGGYAVGERLPSERDLAAAFGVSRPTIREAVIALELDGLVEVKTGSGVYVTARSPKSGSPGATDIGPFELLEARRLVEAEAAALAAQRINDAELAQLEKLVAEMEAENEHDVVMSEDADRRFHMTIAQATQNSAMVAMVEMLWDVRNRSPQSVRFLEHVRAVGVKPIINEHTAILKALRARDPNAARAAMRDHLASVIEGVLQATEVEAVERARAAIAAQRQRFAAKTDT
jgi:DNA-binding FadR family transcriptional regulator